METHDILVVGGGFAGFWAAVAARRVLGPEGKVTLVSRTRGLQLRPRLYEAAPETMAVDLPPLLSRVGAGFVGGAAAGVDLERRQVTLADGRKLEYRRLVAAVGSEIRRPPVPGVEHAYTVDNQDEAIALDRELHRIAARPSPRIAVIGAGFTGIEVATELRNRIAAIADEAAGERLRIALVDRSPVAGPDLGPEMQQVVAEALADARVELRLGRGVAEVRRDGLTLDGAERLDADLVVLTTGMAAAAFVANLPGERDRLGRILVEPDLRAPAARDVVVAGDAAAADTGDGHITLQSCQHALQLGRFAGENAANDLLGRPTRPYRQERYVTCLDLGRSGGVLAHGWERRVVKTGAEGKQVKRWINQAIAPPADAPAEKLIALSETDWRETVAIGG